MLPGYGDILDRVLGAKAIRVVVQFVTRTGELVSMSKSSVEDAVETVTALV
jgi:hypothetical protein